MLINVITAPWGCVLGGANWIANSLNGLSSKTNKEKVLKILVSNLSGWNHAIQPTVIYTELHVIVTTQPWFDFNFTLINSHLSAIIYFEQYLLSIFPVKLAHVTKHKVNTYDLKSHRKKPFDE